MFYDDINYLSQNQKIKFYPNFISGYCFSSYAPWKLGQVREADLTRSITTGDKDGEEDEGGVW